MKRMSRLRNERDVLVSELKHIDDQMEAIRIAETLRETIPTMITIREASSRTGLSYRYIRELCLRGRIPSIRAGNRTLINLEKLIEYLNTGEEADA